MPIMVSHQHNQEITLRMPNIIKKGLRKSIK